MPGEPNRDDFEAIYYRHRDMVFRTAYLILGDAGKADDALQEVFTVLYKSLESYDPEKGKFETWLHRITVNQCVSQLRKKRVPSFSIERLREQGLDLPDADSKLHDDLLIVKEERERVRMVVNSLGAKHRAVLVLKYYDDLSYNEIAEALGIPLGTVKSRLNTAIRAVRERLVEGGVAA